MTDHPMPQSPDIERVVLGMMMLDGKATQTAVERCSESCFYNHMNAAIFRAISRLYSLGHTVDQLAVCYTLEGMGLKKDTGYEAAVMAIAGDVRSAQGLKQYIDILIEKAQRRNVILLCNAMASKAGDDTAEINAILSAASNGVEKIVGLRRTKSYKHIADIIPASYDAIARRANTKSGVVGISTGIARLDKYTGGWKSGELIILAARPSMGKTTLAMEFAIASARTGHPVGVMSMEQPSERIGERMIGNHSRIAIAEVHYNKPTNEDWKRLSESSSYLSELPIIIDDTSGMNIGDMSVMARGMKKDHAIELLIVDYLQLGEGNQRVQRRLQIEEISRGLKSIAKRLGIAVICLSQLSRDSVKENRAPGLHDLRESGSIEQDADVVMFIHNPPESEKERRLDNAKICRVGMSMDDFVELRIDKNRDGVSGVQFLIQFQKQYFRFMEVISDGER